MLTSFDDYPVHQTAEPVAQPSTGDRNFYDRYFFNGYSRAGDLFFAAALGVYPNRGVMDAAFSVVREGRQHVVRASRLAPARRRETRVGPIFVEVLEPLRALHVRVSENDFGLSADLAFYARTGAIEEPRFTFRPTRGSACSCSSSSARTRRRGSCRSSTRRREHRSIHQARRSLLLRARRARVAATGRLWLTRDSTSA
jgi:hypothetical protein